MANHSEQQHRQVTKAYAKRHLPIIQVSFHTETKCYQTGAMELNARGEVLDPSNQVIAVTTQKSLGSPAGAFTVELVGAQWADYRLTPNDIVVIQMGYGDKSKLQTVMVGLIDNIRRTRNMSGDGIPSVRTTVTGRDFGKVLLKTQLKFYPEIGMGKGEDTEKFFLTDEGWITLMQFFTNENMTKGTPAVIVDNIMRYMLLRLNEVKWAVYDEHGAEPKRRTVTLGDVLRYQLAQINFFLPMILTSDQFEGALWNLMERTCMKPFVELWVDVRNPEEAHKVVTGTVEEASDPSKASLEAPYPSPAFQFGSDGAKVVLCMRETPFDSKDKDKLVRHVITQEDTISEELGVSDDEHYNLFWAGTTVNPLGIDLKRQSPPIMNEADVKRYGISPLEVQMEGLEISRERETEDGQNLIQATDTYTAKLKAWFEKNHKYWNGSITIRGKADVRIGQMLDYHPPNFSKEFYIEAVTQSFTIYEDWKTTIQVTRGQTIAEKVDHEENIPKQPEPQTPQTSETTSATDGYHTVTKGDTLYALAKKHFGDSNKWTKIWEANKDMLIARDARNADQKGNYLYPGQKLRIPPK